MVTDEFEQFARRIVREYPTPPRPVPRWPVVKGVLLNRDWLIVGGFGWTVLLLGGVGNLLRPLDNLTIKYLLATLAFFSGGVLVAVHLYYAWTWYKALRYGRLAIARVRKLEGYGPGAHNTFRGLRTWSAVGTWDVLLPHTTFTARFEVSGPWTKQLWEGAQVQVLVDPKVDWVLAELGPPVWM